VFTHWSMLGVPETGSTSAAPEPLQPSISLAALYPVLAQPLRLPSNPGFVRMLALLFCLHLHEPPPSQ